MNDNILLNIIKLRIAVYFQGCNANQWKSIESNDASTLLEYIFPKTGRLAYYNLILEQMRTLHREYIPAGQYFLFNMPVQFEEKMLNYLKNHPEHTMKSLVADPEAFISSWATVACDNSLSPVNVGAIKDNDMELLLRVVAVYYKAAFENETVRAICDNCEIDIPESMVQNEVEQMADDQAARMSNQGIALDMYLQYVGQSMDEFKKSLEPMARVRVKSSLVIEKITEVVNPEVTDADYEEEIKANMGDENQDPKFEVTLTGPETITAGEEFEVVATVNKVEQGTELAQISFNLGFDADALELVNQANNENVVDVEATVPAAWENLTKLGESAGLLEVNFTNATDATSVITEDGKLVITFKFKAKEGVEKAGLWIDHESVASNDPNFVDFAGNGTYLILNAAGETSTEDSSAESAASSAVQTGDGSVNVIVLAIIALVAVAGCAVVIKTRR